jgi:tetrahydromethanopterin S-methyltransferase subunit F
MPISDAETINPGTASIQTLDDLEDGPNVDYRRMAALVYGLIAAVIAGIVAGIVAWRLVDVLMEGMR